MVEPEAIAGRAFAAPLGATAFATFSLAFDFAAEEVAGFDETVGLEALLELALAVFGTGLAEAVVPTFIEASFLTAFAVSVALTGVKRCDSAFVEEVDLLAPGGAFAGAAFFTLLIFTWVEADFAFPFVFVADFGFADFTTELLSLAVLARAETVGVLAELRGFVVLFAAIRDFFLVAAILNYS